LANTSEYVLNTSRDGEFLEVEATTCSTNVTPLAVIAERNQVSFELGATTEECRIYLANITPDQQDALILLSVNDQNVLVELQAETENFFSLSPEIRSVLIFVGGLMAAMAGRVLGLLLDPIYHTIRVQMKYIATKKFFNSVSDSFDKDFAVSEDLKKVANGDYLTNFFLTTGRRVKIKNLLEYIEKWKSGELKPREFRERLTKL